MTAHSAALRDHLRLYLVLDPDAVGGDLIVTTRAALNAGVTMLQFRAKHRTDRAILELATPVRRLCQAASVPFIMNDRLDLALACNADGVHLGVDDFPLPNARSLGGLNLIIGYSPESDAQISAAAGAGASYLGIGPVFATATKQDAGAPLGLVELSRRLRIGGLPGVGIGGIDATNAASVMAAGADGVAVVSAILGAPDPALASWELLAAITRS